MPSLEERIAEREAKKAAKDERRAVTRRDREEQASDDKKKEQDKNRGKRPALGHAQEDQRQVETSLADVD